MRTLHNKIESAKQRLKAKAKKIFCENFGQDEVRKIESYIRQKFDWPNCNNQGAYAALAEFDNWCSNYSPF